MLASAVLELVAERPVRLPSAHYRYSHAALLSLFRTVAPELAEQMHDSQKDRAFTASLLQGGTLNDGLFTGPAGSVWRWRLTGLTMPVSEILMACPWAGQVVFFGQEVFRVAGLNREAEANRETRCCSAKRLLEEVRGGKRPKIVTMDFVSPTTFRYFNRDYPWPEPRLVWRSLRDRWCRTRSDLPDVPGVFTEATLAALPVIPVGWRGFSQRLPLTSERGVDTFTGSFRYDLSRLEPDEYSFALLMARFAFFSGVGRLTTHGLGQTRCQGTS